MRVHCLKSDPDFWQHKFAAIPATILDGAWVRNVVMADDDAGVVEVIKVDAQGHPLFSDGRVLTRLLRGSVQIIAPKIGERVN